MSNINKEKIYDELREYHTDSIPDQLSTEAMNDLKAEFGLIEDQSVSMLLGLVNGKREYVDLSYLFTDFKKKIDRPGHNPKEDSDKNILSNKLDNLAGIIARAKGYAFELRKVRQPKVASAKK